MKDCPDSDENTNPQQRVNSGEPLVNSGEPPVNSWVNSSNPHGCGKGEGGEGLSTSEDISGKKSDTQIENKGENSLIFSNIPNQSELALHPIHLSSQGKGFSYSPTPSPAIHPPLHPLHPPLHHSPFAGDDAADESGPTVRDRKGQVVRVGDRVTWIYDNTKVHTVQKISGRSVTLVDSDGAPFPAIGRNIIRVGNQ